MKLPRGVVWAIDRHVVSHTFGLRYRPGRALVEMLALLDPPPPGVRVRKGTLAGMAVRHVIPDGADEAPRLIWLHGGGFCFNSPRTHATFAAHLSQALGASVILPTYRRAPENPYPAAAHDVLAAYRAITADGTPPILAGDSAGANLALSMAVSLREAGGSQPAGLLLMSPWVDLTLSRESVRMNDGKDAILRAKYLPPLARAYASGFELADRRISPLNADLSGLPPTLIQCGADELFASEGTELAARLETAGTSAELQTFEGMWHVFQVHAGMLPDATGAVERMATWAKPLLA